MLNLNSVMLGTKQPKELVDFYEKVFGKPADMSDSENGFWGWQVGASFVGILNHSKMGGKTKDPGRVMINFETPQVKEEEPAFMSRTKWDKAGSPRWLIPMVTTFN
jgi:hypothetical protein